MGIVLGFLLHDADDVVRVVKKWDPGELANEREYQDALYTYLHAGFPKTNITREFTRRRSTVDFLVELDQEVGIEVKAHLTSRQELRRLIGQLYEYLIIWKVQLVVVICGQNDPQLVKEAEEAVIFFHELAFKPKARFLTV